VPQPAESAPIEVIGNTNDLPDGAPDTNPYWLWVLVGDGGVVGQRVYVRYYADEAPQGLPSLPASSTGPSVRVVNDGSSPADRGDVDQAAALKAAVELLNAAVTAVRSANENDVAPATVVPPGMSAWVTPDDVQRRVQVSKTTAHEYMRAAAGRRVGTGALLRVPVDVWEQWARENLINGRRKRWVREDHSRRPDTSTSGGASGGAGSTTTTAPCGGSPPARPTRRRLGPGSPNGSVRPLIPTLSKPKR
jgi:hypothetical protein